MPENNALSSEKNIASALGAGSKNADTERNARDWEIAKKLGITDEAFAARHPDIKKDMEATGNKFFGYLKKAAWITALSGAAGAAVPLLPVKVIKSWPARIGISIAAGIGAAAVAAFTSVAIFSRRFTKEAADYGKKETAALEQDIAVARAANPALLPDAQSPVVNFAATLTQRDTNHATQAVKSAEQAQTIQMAVSG